jgi:hypothetical protein
MKCFPALNPSPKRHGNPGNVLIAFGAQKQPFVGLSRRSLVQMADQCFSILLRLQVPGQSDVPCGLRGLSIIGRNGRQKLESF